MASRISDVICVIGRSGYFHKDLAAARAGARPNGLGFDGAPRTPGFARIVEPGEIISVMLVLDDASAMGQVMVESFLSAHRGQMPEAAWQKRASDWTPEVSARGWARALAEQASADVAPGVFLVAEDDAGVLIGLVSGGAVEDEPLCTTAEIGALYVVSACRGRGVGGLLLRAASPGTGPTGLLRAPHRRTHRQSACPPVLRGTGWIRDRETGCSTKRASRFR